MQRYFRFPLEIFSKGQNTHLYSREYKKAQALRMGGSMIQDMSVLTYSTVVFSPVKSDSANTATPEIYRLSQSEKD